MEAGIAALIIFGPAMIILLVMEIIPGIQEEIYYYSKEGKAERAKELSDLREALDKIRQRKQQGK